MVAPEKNETESTPVQGMEPGMRSTSIPHNITCFSIDQYWQIKHLSSNSDTSVVDSVVTLRLEGRYNDKKRSPIMMKHFQW